MRRSRNLESHSDRCTILAVTELLNHSIVSRRTFPRTAPLGIAVPRFAHGTKNFRA